MRIKSDKTSILQGIQGVIGVVTSKNTLPILSNILLETGKKRLKLTTTDLDIGIINTVPVEVIEEGSITIPARRFIDIVKELPDRDVEIYTKKNNIIVVECGKAVFKILGVPKEEFPKLPVFTDEEQLILDQQTLKKQLIMTSFAMSHDETRYVLNGICFIITKEKIQLVATDGRRLAITTQTGDTGIKGDKKIILPTKTIQELMRSLQESGKITMVFSNNQVLFRIGELLIISRLIEGEFPNYEQAIPSEAKDKIRVNLGDLISATKRAGLLTTPESQAIRLQAQKDRLTVSKITPEVGEVKEDIQVEYGGEDLLIGFNPSYLLDALKNIEEEVIELELTGPEKPGVVRLNNYIYIVLPMQIV